MSSSSSSSSSSKIHTPTSSRAAVAAMAQRAAGAAMAERASGAAAAAAPPRLTLPPHRPTFNFHQSTRYHPSFTPTPSSSSSSRNPSLFISPTPTPSKRPRASQNPLWVLTFFHLLSLYAVYKWLHGFDNNSPPPLVVFTFFALLGSSGFLIVAHRAWKGRRPVLSFQWAILVGNGGILALSFLLRFQGLISCGPLESICADFAGALAGKVLLDLSKRNSAANKARNARGIAALLLAVFLLSQGWARASCFPLSLDAGYRTRGLSSRIINEQSNKEKDCVKLFSIFAPTLAGVLSAFQRSLATRSPLRMIGRKRVHVLSHAMAAVILFPFAVMHIALMAGPGSWELSRSVMWPLFSTITFGVVLAFYGDSYSEEKLLMPAYSLKTFSIITCCIMFLELLYGLDISLAGFLFCTFILGFGVRELHLAPGELTWEALGDGDSSSFSFSSWVKSPLRHILLDKKSRKIAIFLIINTGFMFVEVFFGFVCNSLGLISDACHMLFDCAALAIGLYASYISRLPANSSFIYGYGRFEVVSGYANAVLLVLVASLIVLESLERILEPQEITTESLLLVSVGGLLVNIIGLIFFHEEHHHAHGSGSCSHSPSLQPGDKSYIENVQSSSSKVVACQSSCSLTHTVDHHSDHNIHHNGDGNVYPSQLENNIEEHSYEEHDRDKSFTFSVKSGIQDLSPIFTLRQQLDNDKNVCVHNHYSPSGAHSHSDQSHEYEQPGEQSTGNTAAHIHTQNCTGVDNISANSNRHFVGQYFIHEDGNERTHKHDKLEFTQPHFSSDGIHGDGHEQDQHVEQCDQGELQCHGISSTCNHSISLQSHNKESPIDHHLNYVHEGGDHQHHHHNSQHYDDHFHSHIPSYDKETPVDHVHVSGHHHDHYHMDHNMQGIFLHVLADTLGSLGVVISTFLIKYKGWLFMDPACSIFISGLIISSVIPLLRNSAEMLLQRVPRFNEQSLKQALKEIEKLPGVQNCQRIHVWAFTNKEVFGSLHLQVSPGSDKLAIRKTVLKLLHTTGIVDLTLEVEDM